MGLSYEEGKKVVWKGFALLLIITFIEVFIALLGNGHLIDGVSLPRYILYPAMVILSAYKAYFIVSEFMHMKYEAKGLALTIVLPLLLLVWAIIAFMWEGDTWSKRRSYTQGPDLSVEIPKATKSIHHGADVHGASKPH